MERVAALQEKIAEKENLLKTKKNKATKVYSDLKQSIFKEKAKLEKVMTELNNFDLVISENAKAYNELAKQIKSGDIFLNKRLMPRKDYYHHFQEIEEGLGGIRNILKNSQEIDPKLVTKSEFTKPKSKWWSALQRRYGTGEYTADAVGGMLKYITAAEYKIAFDPVITEYRNTISKLESNTVTKKGNAFLKWFNDWTNALAGKTNFVDRVAQRILSRQGFAIVKALNSRVKSNAVLGNIRSAIAQIYNIPTAAAYIKNPVDWGAGALKLIKGTDTNTEMQKSVFLKERYLDTDLYKRFDEGVLKAPKKLAMWMLEIGDKKAAQLIWNAAHNEYTRKNGNIKNAMRKYENAIDYADDITRRSIAGRGVGELPLLMQSETVQLAFPFQVEINNQYQALKERIGKKDALGIIGMLITALLMNELSEELTGDRIAGFDYLGAIKDVINGDGGADRILGETISSMPYSNLLGVVLSGGDDGKAQSMFGESDPTRFGIGSMGLKAILDPIIDAMQGKKPDLLAFAANVVLPFGGKQVERTIKAARDVLQGASYTDSGKLRFPIDTDDPLNVAKALTLGQYTTKEGKEYIKDVKPYSETYTSVYKILVDAGIKNTEAIKHIDYLKDIKPIKDASGNATKNTSEQIRDYLFKADMPTKIKEQIDDILINDKKNVSYKDKVSFEISLLPDSIQEKAKTAKSKLGINNGKFLEAYKAQKDIKADKDKKGNSISGSARAKKVYAIQKVLAKGTKNTMWLKANQLYDLLNGNDIKDRYVVTEYDRKIRRVGI